MTEIAQISTAEWIAAACAGTAIAGFIVVHVSRAMRRRPDSLQAYFDFLEGNVMPGFTEDQHRFINERIARIRAGSCRTDPTPKKAARQYRGNVEHAADPDIIALWPSTPTDTIAARIGYSLSADPIWVQPLTIALAVDVPDPRGLYQ